jgi:septal ring factor EnvC (AmiA/AmiB activator)
MVAQKKQLEFTQLLTDAAAKGDPTTCIRAAQFKLAHFETEVTALDRDLEKWRAELSQLGSNTPAADARLTALRAVIREAERNRSRVCRLMDDLDAVVRRHRQAPAVTNPEGPNTLERRG